MLKRFRYWLRSGGRVADLAEEIEAHRAMAQERLEASGMTPADAYHASRRAMGNVTLAREDARAVWVWPWVESVGQDIRHTLRHIRRNPGFAIGIVLVLSIGIGSALSVFGLIEGLVLRSLPVRDPDRLVWFRAPAFSYPVFAEVRTRGDGIFQDLFAWNLERLNVEWDDAIEPTEALRVTGTFYASLGVNAEVGQTFTEHDDRFGGGARGPVAVISHSAWLRRFDGDPSVVGRTVVVERVRHTVIGVTPRGFFGVAPGLAPDITIPLATLATPDELRAPHSAWLHFMGRLRHGVSLDQANAALQGFWPAVLEATTNPGMPADRRARYLARTTALEPGRTGFSRVRNQFAEPLWTLMALVAVLLAVAGASAANLLLARGVARRREVAVRLAIGAGRPRLIRQMLTEACLWSGLAAAVGLLAAAWSSQVLVSMMQTWEEPIALDTVPTWRVLWFAVAVTAGTSALCGVIPTLQATRINPAARLKDAGRTGDPILRRWSLGKGLVLTQVALTVVLVTGSALFVRSLRMTVAQDAGFDRDHIVVVATDAGAAGYKDASLLNFYQALLERLEALSGVESASLSWYPPISDEMGNWTQSIAVDGAPLTPEPTRYVYFNGVSPGYFRTVGTQLLRGRDFTRRDTGGSVRVVIVNESLALRFFGDTSPLGRRISIGRAESRQDLEIVGIVQDAKYRHLKEPQRSIAYLPLAQLAEYLTGTNLVAELRVAGPMAPVVDRARLEVQALDPRVPTRIHTVADRIRESLVTDRIVATLATALGFAALALACASLYGLIAYGVSRRTPEIGLKLALGGTPGAVLGSVLKDAFIVAALGVALGLAGAVVLGRLIRSLLFQVGPADPVSLTTAGSLVLIVAVCAALVPGWKASRVDPVIALRHE